MGQSSHVRRPTGSSRETRGMEKSAQERSGEKKPAGSVRFRKTIRDANDASGDNMRGARYTNDGGRDRRGDTRLSFVFEGYSARRCGRLLRRVVAGFPAGGAHP